MYRRSAGRWDTESLNKAKKTLASQFNGEAGFKVDFKCGKDNEADYDKVSGTVTASKDGIVFEVNFNSVGYSEKTYDINVDKDHRWDDKYSTIGRITTNTDLYKSSLRKGFREYAQSRVNQELTADIIAPAKRKSQENSGKTFAKWEKANAKLIEHESIWECKAEDHGYRTKEASKIGTDSIVTRVKAYCNEKFPSTTQVFGIITQSGIEVHNINSNEIEVIGDGDKTTKFLKLLNSPLDWVN